MERTQITKEQVEAAVEAFRKKLYWRLQQKGWGTLASTHEIAGVLGEEHNEMMKALEDNDEVEFKKELLDIAVGAVFGYACAEAKTLDW